MKKNILYTIILFTGLLFTGACKKDSPQELAQESTEVQKANELLSGDIVLNTIAKMGGVDKTLLPDGCPTKFNFGWDSKKQKLKVGLPMFKVGSMPFGVYFRAYATYSEVSYFKKKEYPPEKGWLQFRADDGLVILDMPEGEEPPTSDGAGIVTGFVNPKTQEIELNIVYNMMLVTSFCFKQKIDKSRLANYEEEFKQYEKDLKKYKEDNGIK